jgi:5-methylcytosine-specific restriction endonuclease McrA
MKPSKQCAICGKTFYKSDTVSIKVWNTTTKNCSRRCSALSGREKTIERNKAGRGRKASTETRLKQSLARKGKVSSMKGKTHTEETKKRIRLSTLKAQTPEVRLKKSLAHRGPKAYNWKGGRMSLKHRMRTNAKYIEWRTAVFTRDKFTCTHCGDNKGGNLEADHIITVSNIFDVFKIKTIDQAIDNFLLWETSNGRTLCKPCHIKRHNRVV